MADLSAVFISIDIYSSSLDKLMKKTEKATSNLTKMVSIASKAAGLMLFASAQANNAAKKNAKSWGGNR